MRVRPANAGSRGLCSAQSIAAALTPGVSLPLTPSFLLPSPPTRVLWSAVENYCGADPIEPWLKCGAAGSLSRANWPPSLANQTFPLPPPLTPQTPFPACGCFLLSQAHQMDAAGVPLPREGRAAAAAREVHACAAAHGSVQEGRPLPACVDPIRAWGGAPPPLLCGPSSPPALTRGLPPFPHPGGLLHRTPRHFCVPGGARRQFIPGRRSPSGALFGLLCSPPSPTPFSLPPPAGQRHWAGLCPLLRGLRRVQRDTRRPPEGGGSVRAGHQPVRSR